MIHHADRAARRLLATAGLGDLVRGLVDQIHRQVKVGKGDENINLHIPTGGGHKESDHEYKSEDASMKQEQHQHMADDHHQQAEDADKAGNQELKNHHDLMNNHHQVASNHFGEAAQHYQNKRMGKGDKSIKQAKLNVGRATFQKTRMPKNPVVAPEAAEPEQPKQPKQPKQPGPTPNPGQPRQRKQKTGPVHGPGSTPHPGAMPSPGVTPNAHTTPGASTPPQHTKLPKVTKSGQLRAAPRGGPAPVDHNDPSGAAQKTAHADIPVSGTINGRSMNTTISAGQTYHVKEVDGQTQLIMPGLFGRFFVDSESKGKL